MNSHSGCSRTPSAFDVQDSHSDIRWNAKATRNIEHRIANVGGLFGSASDRDAAGIRIAKRVLDIVVSLLLLVLLAPILALVALVVKIESRGPIVFKQMRALSPNDKPFTLYKFRTMVESADNQKEHLLHLNEADGVLFKIRNDPRLTNVGRFIRRHSIDELPQLFNVLRGDMSLVGPRPLPVKDIARLAESDTLHARRNVKPGMTGLWQISGRSDLGFREMIKLDTYYIEHQRLLFDLEILLRTIPVVMFAKGAY